MEAWPRSNAPLSCDLRLVDTGAGAIASPRRPVRRRDPTVYHRHLAPLAEMLRALARTRDRGDAAAGKRASAPGTGLTGRVVPAQGDEPAAGPARCDSPRDRPRTRRSPSMCAGDVLCSGECANSRESNWDIP